MAIALTIARHASRPQQAMAFPGRAMRWRRRREATKRCDIDAQSSKASASFSANSHAASGTPPLTAAGTLILYRRRYYRRQRFHTDISFHGTTPTMAIFRKAMRFRRHDRHFRATPIMAARNITLRHAFRAFHLRQIARLYAMDSAFSAAAAACRRWASCYRRESHVDAAMIRQMASSAALHNISPNYHDQAFHYIAVGALDMLADFGQRFSAFLSYISLRVTFSPQARAERRRRQPSRRRLRFSARALKARKFLAMRVVPPARYRRPPAHFGLLTIPRLSAARQPAGLRMAWSGEGKVYRGELTLHDDGGKMPFRAMFRCDRRSRARARRADARMLPFLSPQIMSKAQPLHFHTDYRRLMPLITR